jgi:hypothetical protein
MLWAGLDKDSVCIFDLQENKIDLMTPEDALIFGKNVVLCAHAMMEAKEKSVCDMIAGIRQNMMTVQDFNLYEDDPHI